MRVIALLFVILTALYSQVTFFYNKAGVTEAPTYNYFYFPTTVTSNISPAYAAGWDSTRLALRRQMVGVKSGTAITTGTSIVMADGGNIQGLDRQYISDSIAAQTISGKVRGQLMVRESSTGDNIDQMYVSLRVFTADGSTVRGTLLAFGNKDTTRELISNATLRSMSIIADSTVQSVVCSDGDRIVIEIGYNVSTTGTSIAGSAKWGDNATDITWRDNTGTTDKAGWLYFANGIKMLH